jgi:KipI family sensor histidine kinase inhibitor
MRFVQASDRSLLIYLGDTPSEDVHRRVVSLLRVLEREPLPGIVNLHPAYCSILAVFDPLQCTHADLELELVRCAGSAENILPVPRTIEIPVHYGAEYGPDLEEIAVLHGLTVNQVIELHSAPTYSVRFLGFLPGFPYLAGLPAELATPRLDVPRPRVPAGSVGIAGSQTGIYPFTTPGGWRLVGRTELEIFRVDRNPPALVNIGDSVRFVPAA